MSVAGMSVAASSMLDRVVGNCCGSMGVLCTIVSLEIILSAPCLDAKAGAPEDTVAVDCIGPCSRLEACGPSNVCVCNRWKLFTVSATVQFQEAAMIELRRCLSACVSVFGLRTHVSVVADCQPSRSAQWDFPQESAY